MKKIVLSGFEPKTSIIVIFTKQKRKVPKGEVDGGQRQWGFGGSVPIHVGRVLKQDGHMCVSGGVSRHKGQTEQPRDKLPPK